MEVPKIDNDQFYYDVGTLVIGDSFAEMFKLISGVEVLKFKGGTAKGLTRFDNENRIKLMRTVYNRSFSCCVFTFGQVDLHLSFYYDIISKSLQTESKDDQAKLKICKENIIETALVHRYTDLATHYIDFIASLQNIGRKIVFAVYPSSVCTSNIPFQLIKYGVLKKEDVVLFSKELWWEIANPSKRIERLNIFNDLLEKACESQNIEFYSANNYILDDNNNVKKEFIDLSPCNIHLRWKPLLEIWVDLLEKYDIGICRDNLVVNIEQLENEYQDDKIERFSNNNINNNNNDNNNNNNNNNNNSDNRDNHSCDNINLDFELLVNYLKERDNEFNENLLLSQSTKKRRKK